MSVSSRLKQPDPDITEHNDAIAEMRVLVADLRDAARDSRQLANRYAELLKSVVEEYAGEFEQRAVATLARLEAAR